MPHPNDKTYDPTSNKIFVFGSNLAGVHGAGAAKYAHKDLGAKWGRCEGISGRTYAIPTKDCDLETLQLELVHMFVVRFVWFAKCHPQMQFFVTRIGCGFAGFTDKEIAPMFADAPDNCELPIGWDHPETLT